MASTATARSGSESPRERLAALPPARQAQLLDPAEAEFAEHGFERASLNRILAAAGMSKGQAYYYVADKADLYRAVIERALDRLVAAMDAPFPQPADADAFWAQIRDVLARMALVLKEDARLAALGRGIDQNTQTQAALAEPMAKIRGQVERLVVLGQSVGAVRTDLPQSLLVGVLFAMAREIDRWFAANWDVLDLDEALRLNNETVDLIRAAAAPDTDR